MKNIYIILTQSGTMLSRFFKMCTHAEYNHASICLSDDFEKFYSFGRLKPNNAFVGGFVTENAFTNVFGKFDHIPCQILKLEITDEQYTLLNNLMNSFYAEREKYSYDLINAILTGTNYSLPRNNKFFCSGFVAYSLDKANIELPKDYIKTRPIDFCKIPNCEIIYKGDLKKWCLAPATL